MYPHTHVQEKLKQITSHKLTLNFRRWPTCEAEPNHAVCTESWMNKSGPQRTINRRNKQKNGKTHTYAHVWTRWGWKEGWSVSRSISVDSKITSSKKKATRGHLARKMNFQMAAASSPSNRVCLTRPPPPPRAVSYAFPCVRIRSMRHVWVCQGGSFFLLALYTHSGFCRTWVKEWCHLCSATPPSHSKQASNRDRKGVGPLCHAVPRWTQCCPAALVKVEGGLLEGCMFITFCAVNCCLRVVGWGLVFCFALTTV